MATVVVYVCFLRPVFTIVLDTITVLVSCNYTCENFLKPLGAIIYFTVVAEIITELI